MSCIKNGIIQKYIDGEATPKEVTFIETHILSCNKCAAKIENQRRLATSVKKAINLLAKESIEIPKFTIPAMHNKRLSSNTKRLLYIIAAASILLFVIVMTQNKEMKKSNEILLEIGSSIDVDANQPVTQMPMVVNFIDEEGNIFEYFIN